MVAKDEGDRMSSQFTLDGVGNEGSGNGEFCCPHDVTVLGLSGEVAVVDVSNNCVQIFDSSEGNYKLQFGSYGTIKADTCSAINGPSAITSDAHGTLQVLSPEGRHLYTRTRTSGWDMA